MSKVREKTREKTFVITVDGPAAAGKGTLTRMLAKKLGYRRLDSGKLYRSVAKNAEQVWNLKIPQQTQEIADQIDKKLRITDEFIEKIENDKELREEKVALLASLIAPQKAIREALAKQQVAYIYSSTQGIVLDGRDMGTIICPNAPCKIFLTASPEARAKRRYQEINNQQINEQQISDQQMLDQKMLDPKNKNSYALILRDMRARDARDLSRAQAPLLAADDALIIDNSNLTIPLVLAEALNYASRRGAIMCLANK